MIRSTAPPTSRMSGSRELFLVRLIGSGTRRGVDGGACTWPNVREAGLANICVYSPGICGAAFDGGGGILRFGRGVENTWVALADVGPGAAGVGGGGGAGMEPCPKIWVNSPASLGCEVGRGGVGMGPVALCDGVMGDWK